MNKHGTYKVLRSKGWRARDAWSRVKTLAAWNEMGGYIDSYGVDEVDEKTIRLRILPDEGMSYEDLAGDCFNPDLHSNKRELVSQEKAFIREIEIEGVWGVVGEYWNGETWEHADSCWGFIGDHWQESGHDETIMQEAMDAFNSQDHCPACGRPKPLVTR